MPRFTITNAESNNSRVYHFETAAALAEWTQSEILMEQAYFDGVIPTHQWELAHPPEKEFGHYEGFMKLVRRHRDNWGGHTSEATQIAVHKVQRELGIALTVFPDLPVEGEFITSAADIDADAQDGTVRIPFSEDGLDIYNLVFDTSEQAFEWAVLLLQAKIHYLVCRGHFRVTGDRGTRDDNKEWMSYVDQIIEHWGLERVPVFLRNGLNDYQRHFGMEVTVFPDIPDEHWVSRAPVENQGFQMILGFIVDGGDADEDDDDDEGGNNNENRAPREIDPNSGRAARGA